MPVRVYPSPKKSALSDFQAKIINEKLNKSNQQWSVSYTLSTSGVVFNAVGPTDLELETAIVGFLPGGQNTKIIS